MYKWISPYPEIKKSHRRKNYWDQIEHACEWLTLCKTINRHLIENVRNYLLKTVLLYSHSNIVKSYITKICIIYWTLCMNFKSNIID